VITEGNPPLAPATKGELDSWIATYMTPNTWTLDSVDPQPQMETYFGVGRENYYTIDLSTMKIVGHTADVTAALNDLNAHLP
jgi:hypothetical protein